MISRILLRYPPLLEQPVPAHEEVATPSFPLLTWDPVAESAPDGCGQLSSQPTPLEPVDWQNLEVNPAHENFDDSLLLAKRKRLGGENLEDIGLVTQLGKELEDECMGGQQVGGLRAECDSGEDDEVDGS